MSEECDVYAGRPPAADTEGGEGGGSAVEREVAAALAQRRKPMFSGDARSFS